MRVMIPYVLIFFIFLGLGLPLRRLIQKSIPKAPPAFLLGGACGALSVLFFLQKGFTAEALVFSLSVPVLLALSVIDLRTKRIPPGYPLFLFVLGLLGLFFCGDLRDRLIGPFSVGLLLWVVWLLTGGRAVGGGDVKLMAACGLLLGWRDAVTALFLGCLGALLIHPLRMKLSGEGRVLALGPYLAAGVVLAALFGEKLKLL